MIILDGLKKNINKYIKVNSLDHEHMDNGTCIVLTCNASVDDDQSKYENILELVKNYIRTELDGEYEDTLVGWSHDYREFTFRYGAKPVYDDRVVSRSKTRSKINYRFYILIVLSIVLAISVYILIQRPPEFIKTMFSVVYNPSVTIYEWGKSFVGYFSSNTTTTPSVVQQQQETVPSSEVYGKISEAVDKLTSELSK
jgi:hypothetical protein